MNNNDYEIKKKYPFLLLERCNNIEIKNLMPINKQILDNIIPDYYYCHYFYNNTEQKDINDKIVNLGEETYIILNNKWPKHFYHFMIEGLPVMELYLNYFSNFKLICNNECAGSDYFKFIVEHLKLKDNILIIEPNTIYKGNFIYLFLLPKYNRMVNFLKINNDNIWMYKDDQIIINKIIEISNNTYKDIVKPYNKIWISRRDLTIETYHHKRFCTNINDISESVLNNDFKELHFGTSDINLLLQIYYVNNAKIIFSETGSSFVNIIFMHENTSWITNNDISNPDVDDIIKNLCDIKKVKLNMINNSEFDIENIYSNTPNSMCKPYKINNINNFKIFFNNVMLENKEI